MVRHSKITSKPWSISTTVRNPLRLRGFLSVLNELEGQPFDVDNQIKYQIMLIQNRLYKPTIISQDQVEILDSWLDNVIPYELAEEIFYQQDYTDPAMRGRNSAAELNKMGLAIAKSSQDIKITTSGKYLLSEDCDLEVLFLRSFIKWQLPNKTSASFLEKHGFSVKPFVATLHLINKVNIAWERLGHRPYGLDREEFSIFVPTLIDYEEIQSQAERIVLMRKGAQHMSLEAASDYKNAYFNNFVSSFFETDGQEQLLKHTNTLLDYGDNIIRYFRLTGYLRITGNDIDLERGRRVEIRHLLGADDASPSKFASIRAYQAYIAEISQPRLPWENEVALREIADSLHTQVKLLQVSSGRIQDSGLRAIANLNEEQLKAYIQELRTLRKSLQNREHYSNSQKPETVRDHISALSKFCTQKPQNDAEVVIEQLGYDAMSSLDDALSIRPNYPVNDDNKALAAAPTWKPDIECFYETYNLTCELTARKGRDQWFDENYPIMRRLKEFSEKHDDKNSYCLFIAPEIHSDTLKTFWSAIRNGYQGRELRIVPLTIQQLISILMTTLSLRQKGRTIRHTMVCDLFNRIIESAAQGQSADLWAKRITLILSTWCIQLLSNRA